MRFVLPFLMFFNGFMLALVIGKVRANVPDPDIYLTINMPEPVPTMNTEFSCENSIQCKTMAEAIYHEARGETLFGQLAVGYVIRNRVRSSNWPDNIVEVVNDGCNFTYKCDGSYERGIEDLEAWEMSLYIAEKVMLEQFTDPTEGATHYVNLKKLAEIPRWLPALVRITSIGNHTFYRQGA